MGLALTYGVGQYATGTPSESHSAGWDRAYKAGGRGIIWAHGAETVAPRSQQPWVASKNTLPLMYALASLGCPIMCGDFSDEAWGNDTAQALITSAWTWIKAQYGAKTDKVILAALSMGALNVLNWARANPTLVKAILLFYPVVNLQAQHDGSGGASNTYTSEIETAYGGLAAFNAAEPTHDPSYSGIPASFTGIPIYMGYSDADTVVGSANQTAWISAVGGSALTSRVYHSATHADMTQVNVNDVTTWVESYT